MSAEWNATRGPFIKETEVDDDFDVDDLDHDEVNDDLELDLYIINRAETKQQSSFSISNQLLELLSCFSRFPILNIKVQIVIELQSIMDFIRIIKEFNKKIVIDLLIVNGL